MATREAAAIKWAGVSTRSRQLWLIGSVVLLAILASVPLFTDRRDLLNLMFLVYLAVCLGQSWNIVGGFAGQVNLGHAAFWPAGWRRSCSRW
jgi:branched-chain amino acid transport system permease protein